MAHCAAGVSLDHLAKAGRSADMAFTHWGSLLAIFDGKLSGATLAAPLGAIPRFPWKPHWKPAPGNHGEWGRRTAAVSRPAHGLDAPEKGRVSNTSPHCGSDKGITRISKLSEAGDNNAPFAGCRRGRPHRRLKRGNAEARALAADTGWIPAPWIPAAGRGSTVTGPPPPQHRKATHPGCRPRSVRSHPTGWAVPRSSEQTRRGGGHGGPGPAAGRAHQQPRRPRPTVRATRPMSGW